MYNDVQTRKFFTLKYPASIRIWHWLTALFVAGSLITVLFAQTLFDEHEHEGPPMKQQAQNEEAQKPSDPEPTRNERNSPEEKAAHMYRHKIWDAHRLIGFGVSLLFLSRIIIEVSRSKESRLITRINRAVRIPVSEQKEKNEKLHYMLSKWGYVFFYALLLFTTATGLIMAFEDAAPLKSLQRPAHAIHETLQYFMYFYILAHLAGVIYADLKAQKGIVSAMINGGD